MDFSDKLDRRKALQHTVDTLYTMPADVPSDLAAGISLLRQYINEAIATDTMVTNQEIWEILKRGLDK